MKFKKIFVLLLAAAMLLCATPVFAAETFTDVPADAYYAEAVDWAVEQTITNGKGGGKFAPNDTVTRAEAVTFLWRMAGRPEPTKTETFTDVESDPNNSWYKTAVQWAVEQGITNGTGNGMFSPAVTCQRGMILTMLYRMQGNPLDEAMAAVVSEDPEEMTLEDFGYLLIQSVVEVMRSEDGLSDVKKGDYFELPVIWAILTGVLGENMIDSEARAVHPSSPCPRGEMVYFLYAAAQYESMASGGDNIDSYLPIETGTVPETVVLDKDGVKVTVTGIECAPDSGEAWLALTAENSTDKELNIDTLSIFVNTFVSTPSTFIPEEEDGFTFYSDVYIPAGESRSFYAGLNYLAEKGITEVREIEIRVGAYTVTRLEDSYQYDEYAFGEPVTIRTSLYDSAVSYEPEGTAVYDKDGLKVLVVEAKNHPYAGPQITVYAYNAGKQKVELEVAELKLDGVTVEPFFGLTVPAGKRCMEKVYFDVDYSNIPTVKEAELTIRMLDPETGEAKTTFAPVKITFTD